MSQLHTLTINLNYIYIYARTHRIFLISIQPGPMLISCDLIKNNLLACVSVCVIEYRDNRRYCERYSLFLLFLLLLGFAETSSACSQVLIIGVSRSLMARTIKFMIVCQCDSLPQHDNFIILHGTRVSRVSERA